MKNYSVKLVKAIVRNLLNTFENKITAIVFIFIGWLSAKIDGDATFYVMALICCVPMFFATRKWITWSDRS